MFVPRETLSFLTTLAVVVMTTRLRARPRAVVERDAEARWAVIGALARLTHRRVRRCGHVARRIGVFGGRRDVRPPEVEIDRRARAVITRGAGDQPDE